MAEPFYSLVGDELTVNLHAGQSRAINIVDREWDTLRVLAVFGGWQGGKTLIGAPYLHYCMDRREREGRVGTTSEPLDYIAASATYDVLRLKMLPALEGYFTDYLDWGRYSISDKIFYRHDGLSRIILRSADSKVGLESFTALDGWFDEAGRDEVELTAYESLMRGLAVHMGHLLVTTTIWNMGWIKLVVYDPAMGGDSRYRVVTFPSLENPTFDKREWDRAKDSMPDWKFRMRYCAEFTRPAGLIYGDYSDSYREQGGNLVKPFSIPATWLRDVGVDFGGSIHNAQVWIAEDPRTCDLYVYREVCGIDSSGPEQARSAAEYQEPIRRASGGAPSEDEHRANWGIAGFPVERPEISDVEAGIDRVIGLFKSKRLFVFDTMTRLRSELGTYSRELDDAGEPLQRIANKERYHLLDACRYVASGYTLDRPTGIIPEEPAEVRTERFYEQQRKNSAPKRVAGYEIWS